MSEKLTKQPITTDPSKFSFREEALNLRFLEKRYDKDTVIYIDEETGEKFHKIGPYNASFQKLLTLILKGIINVSDVVKVGDNYYSHEQNFDNLESSKENTIAEVEADIFILWGVFNDGDHGYHSTTERWHPNSVLKLEHHNLLINETDQKLNFFDFCATKLGNYKTVSIEEDFLELERMFKVALVHEDFGLINPNKNILDILKKKVKLLVELFSDNEFERFKKIVQRSEIELDEGKQRTLFKNIKLRLQALSKVLSEIEPGN